MALALKGLATAKVGQMGSRILLTQDDKGRVWSTGGGREALRDRGAGPGREGPCSSAHLSQHRISTFLSTFDVLPTCKGISLCASL